MAAHNNKFIKCTEKLSQSPPRKQKRLNCRHFLYSQGTLHSFHDFFQCKLQAGQQRRNCWYLQETWLFPIKYVYGITRCNFWWIKQVDKSIEPSIGIFGNGCDSSQHQRTSRTNSTQRKEMAIMGWRKQKKNNIFISQTLIFVMALAI